MVVKAATTAVFLVSIALCASAPPAIAKSRHRHPPWAPTVQSPPSPSVGARDPAKFYPDEIEGGVRGNLSFNNQLRKLSDPLNANGGGG